MKSLFKGILEIGGFSDVQDYGESMIHLKVLPLTLLISLGSFLTGFFVNNLGINEILIPMYVFLILSELCVGLIASLFIKGEKFSGKKFSRWGFKLWQWLTVFFVLFKLSQIFSEDSWQKFTLNQLHNTTLLIATLEYLWSFLDNVAILSGNSKVSRWYLRYFSSKIKSIKKEMDNENKES